MVNTIQSDRIRVFFSSSYFTLKGLGETNNWSDITNTLNSGKKKKKQNRDFTGTLGGMRHSYQNQNKFMTIL
jgi:hypothetical protein